MKHTILEPKEITILFVTISVPVMYEQEEIPDDFPLRRDYKWLAVVEIDNGRIENWPRGRAEKMHLTVKDCGRYSLINDRGQSVASINEDYVPHGVVPGRYGDTIELDIAEDGTIKNWPKNPDVSAFFKKDNDDE